MAVSIKVYLDGTEVIQEPIGLRQLNEHLYYSNEISSYVTEVDGTLTFIGTEYDYLYDKFRNDVCATVEIAIIDESEHVIDFNGYINVSDIVFQPDTKYAVCEIQNNNITSRIDNNKSIECVLTVGRTKNDLTYSVTQQTITIYSPDKANTITREGIRVFDAFKSIIAFVSDNEIGFVSDYFDYNTNNGNQVYSVLMTGEELRTGNGNKPTISFNQLFTDLNALENLAIAFEDGNIRIEDKDYFKQQSSTVSFDSVRGLSQYLATETLYARVKFGSVKTLGTFGYLQDIRFNGMQQESYHLGGQCNTDTTLDLSTTKIVTDTNIIQDVLPSAGGMGGTGNSNFDDDVMIVQCDSNNETLMTLKPASSTDYYMNNRFINREVAPRWFGQIPQSIYAFLGNGNDGCYINQVNDYAPTSYNEGFQPTQESPLPWNDANGNYSVQNVYFPTYPYGENDPTGGLLSNLQMDIGIYTAPANGVYTIEIDVTTEGDSAMFVAKMISNTLGGGGGGIEIPQTYIGGNLYRSYGSGTFYLNTGEYIGARWYLAGVTRILAGSTLKVSDPLGGLWNVYDSSKVYQIENQFKYPIAVEDWKMIKEFPFKAMEITHVSGDESGWLKDISRNIISGISDVTLLSKNG